MFKNNWSKGLLMAGALFLVGCSEIQANPSDNSASLVTGLVSDLEKNIYEVVYDGLRTSGTIKEQALQDVLLLIAEDKFGTYEEIQTNAEKVDLKEDIQSRIYEKMYALISSGSYETKNLFYEERFANFIKRQLYPLNKEQADPFTEAYAFPAYNQANISNGTVVNEAIHLDYYEDYILGEVVPDILRELLVEKYLLEEDYASLGRTYARKVNYIALKVSDRHPEAVKYLMDTFIDQYITSESYTGVADLEMLANAYRGINLSDDETALLESAGLLDVDEGVNKTLYGEILDKYNKIDINVLLTDKTIEDEFTGNGQYTPEKGLEYKERTLAKQDFTTDGWFVKNGGLTSLPTEIRDRLFNIGVANGVDRTVDEKDPSYTGSEAQTSDFVRNINGVNYLIPQTSQQGDDRNFLWYDAGSSAYYLIQIVEAVNTTKMSKTATANYDAIKGEGALSAIATQVAKLLGTREGNKTSSTLHWLEQAELTFHDQTIFDYFKEKYPDLYDTDSSAA